MPQSPPPDFTSPHPRDRKHRRMFVGVAALTIAVVIVPGCLFLWLYLYAVSPGPLPNSKDTTVYIPPGSGLREIGTILTKSAVIDADNRFLILAKFMGVARKLKAGEYLFSAKHTPRQILDDLAHGKTILRPITITEGTNIFQIADLLDDQGWADQLEFLALIKSPSLLQELNLKVDSLEGYLFPDTYLFPAGEKIKVIVKQMVSRTRLVLSEECRETKADGFSFNCSDPANFPIPKSNEHIEVKKDNSVAKKLLNNHQVLTLASIVEKETGLTNERPLVARVFLNRLTKKMKLQADPTVIYGLQKFGSPLSKKDLKTVGPYNTYTSRGLPIGPICSPGRASIAAVFRPSEESYYYFVSQNDGSHAFSKSLKEHNKAVKRFRKAASAQK